MSEDKKTGPNRSRTGDFGIYCFDGLQSYTLPLSYRSMLLIDGRANKFIKYISGNSSKAAPPELLLAVLVG